MESRVRIRRSAESGQALVELVVGIIALACVFLGVLMAAVLGSANIQGVLDARASADMLALTQSSGGAGASIVQWNYGDDKMLMTPDDTASTGAEGDSSLYDGQLSISTSARFPNLGISSFSEAFPSGLSSSSLYLSAANLVAGSCQSSPMADGGLTELQFAIGALLGKGGFSLSNEVYMPLLNQGE